MVIINIATLVLTIAFVYILVMEVLSRKRTYYSDDPSESWDGKCIKHPDNSNFVRLIECNVCKCICGLCKCDKEKPLKPLKETYRKYY